MPARRHGQFRLLASRRVGPLCATWFLGAVHDVVVVAALGAMLLADPRYDGAALGFLAGAAIAYVAPQGFSALAGRVVEAVAPARLIRLAKLAELGIAGLAALALLAQSIPALFAALVLLGVRAATAGPARRALLAAQLAEEELVAGHALDQAAAFAAVALGAVAAGWLLASSAAALWLAALVVALAAAGWAASLGLPATEDGRGGRMRWWVRGPRRADPALADRAVKQSRLGVAWCILLATICLALLFAAALAAAGGASALPLLALVSGLVAGALACDRLSRQRVELGLVPIGAVGVSAFGLDAALAVGANGAMAAGSGEGVLAPVVALSAASSPRLLIDLALLGVSWALFAVPLQANIQARTASGSRTRVYAASQELTVRFVFGGAALAAACLAWGGSVPALLLALAAVNLGVAAYIFTQVPEFAMRLLVWAVSHSFYRVRHEGLAAIPERGAAVLVCNHVSYVDALLLAGAVRRPIRFVMYKPIYDIPVLRFVFRVSGAIPIAAQQEDPRALEAAFAAIRGALAGGDLLGIFPEGRLTEDGRIGVFRKGIERILAETPVPVVPMALRGLWGSFFSRHGKGPFRRLAGRFWSRVVVVAGEPVPPAQATADGLRERVLALAAPA